MNLPELFRAFVRANNLLPDDRPTLLAVSGGVDSVVMAHLFQTAGFPFGIAHCNFQLRGQESDSDQDFVQKLAADFDSPFFAKRFDTKTYAEQNGLSVQMAARELRYAWFREIALENNFARIATAHNLNDSIETVLFNFVRGTGPSGLKGISISSNNVIRPLLFAARADIETYASEQKVAWREDRSNDSDDYARNFLRHQVIPKLEELNPNFLQTAARNLARLRETDENLHFLLKAFFGEKTDSENDFSIDKQRLGQLPVPRRALRELLKNYKFTEEQARQIAENLDHVGLELYSNSGWRLLNDREKILLVAPQSTIRNPQSAIAAIQSDDLMLTLPEGKKLVLMHSDFALSFPDGRAAVLVDAEKLRFPLLLRPWQPGDSFQPFGMGGHSQKLQDFFTNQKLSRLEKEKIWVLENGNEAVIWVVGHRLDERFKVTAATKKFLKISCL